MRKPRAFLAATVAASFLASSCYTVVARPLPPPGERESVTVRGVVLGAGSARETFEFSDVESAIWSETSLTVTGALNAPGQANHGRVETTAFPLADVSEVIVREFDGNRTSVIVGAVIVGASVLIAFAVTGKTTEGGPIGGAR